MITSVKYDLNTEPAPIRTTRSVSVKERTGESINSTFQKIKGAIRLAENPFFMVSKIATVVKRPWHLQ